MKYHRDFYVVMIQVCHLVATRDLAKLYQCKNGTKEINQAVKNNIEKFPERFSFRIEKNETRGGRYKNPRVFTE